MRSFGVDSGVDRVTPAEAREETRNKDKKIAKKKKNGEKEKEITTPFLSGKDELARLSALCTHVVVLRLGDPLYDRM